MSGPARAASFSKAIRRARSGSPATFCSRAGPSCTCSSIRAIRRLHAATAHFVYGPTTHYSDDFGKTWTQAKQVPALPRPSKSGRPASTVEEMFRAESGENIKDKPETMIKVWHIEPGRLVRAGRRVRRRAARLPVRLTRSRRNLDDQRAAVRPSAQGQVQSRRWRFLPAHHHPRSRRSSAHVHRHLGRRHLSHR